MTPTEAFRILLEDFGYIIEPTSCSCGGLFSWLKPHRTVEGKSSYVMVGCICHTNPVELADDKEAM